MAGILNSLDNYFLAISLFGWITIFLGVVLIYILIYVVISIVIGRSIVITKLVRAIVVNKIENKQAESGSAQQKADQLPLKSEDPIEIAKQAHAEAEEAKTIAIEAKTIAQAAESTAEKAKNIIPIFYKKDRKATINQERKSTIIADQYYYLPTASLVIKATATVIITKSNFDDGSSSTAADLTQLQWENTVVIEADTKQLFSLNYNSFSFANDELRLNTNTSGLLESLSVTTEDRISNIISEITSAPKNILAAPSASFKAANLDGQDKKQVINETTQIVVYTNTFLILSEEVENGFFGRNWKINVDVTNDKKITKDASFRCRLNTRKNVASIPLDESIDGILTRPLQKVRIDVQLTDNTISPEVPLQYQILIPDHSVLINVPIKRAPFVKKIHTPKFSNGLLTENYINKPSEVEGALSIPINILKAIVSIPAQLLSFKIAHIQEETALETAKQNLAKAQLLSKQDEDRKAEELLKVRSTTEKVAKRQENILSAINEVATVQKSDKIKRDLANNLQQLEIKKRLLNDILLGTDRSNLTKIDIDNINNLQQEIQKIQTAIDNIKSTF